MTKMMTKENCHLVTKTISGIEVTLEYTEWYFRVTEGKLYGSVYLSNGNRIGNPHDPENRLDLSVLPDVVIETIEWYKPSDFPEPFIKGSYLVKGNLSSNDVDILWYDGKKGHFWDSQGFNTRLQEIELIAHLPKGE